MQKPSCEFRITYAHGLHVRVGAIVSHRSNSCWCVHVDTRSLSRHWALKSNVVRVGVSVRH